MSDLGRAGERMRRDWDERARTDAERFVYTRDSGADESDFERSGEANYDQLVRPFLPILLDGRSAGDCRVLEIGCGVGRMTQWFAREFASVDAVDVSAEMIRRAGERLRECGNVALHAGSGYDLAFLPDESFDLAFSYIVFQHIPERAVIENYVREAARVLKKGGAFKFQVNGDQSPEYRAHARDTWLGETFSPDEVREMLDRAGLRLVTAEGEGTQYFVITARKPDPAEPQPAGELRAWVLPGDAASDAQLTFGWGRPVDGSWRPVEPESGARFLVTPGRELRFFLALYIWPSEPVLFHTVTVRVDGEVVGTARLNASGDHMLEFATPPPASPFVTVGILIDPPCRKPYAPAVRALGFYTRRRKSQ